MGGVEHDLWVGDHFNVAPARLEKTKAIKAKGFTAMTPRELDYVMFKCMTTMGGPDTFKALLPRFVRALAASPREGWTADARVLLGKLKMADFDLWPRRQRAAAAAAIEHLAAYLLELDRCDREEPDADNQALLDWAKSVRAGA